MGKLKNSFQNIIKKATKAEEAYEIKVIQDLWSGYGKIIRFGLKGAAINSVIVKYVTHPKVKNQYPGKDQNLSHLRKLKSYQVETAWYKHWGVRCDDNCRIPNCLAVESDGQETIIVLEDLDDSGFTIRRSRASWEEIKNCLRWLAYFHATFMGEKPDKLWKIGTYWHLDTRPEELRVLKDKQLKDAASKIDKKLNDCFFKTLVHGDAKLENFCFSKNGRQVSAVDFQYVGGGCGMKDVAYFIESCLYEEECGKLESQILDVYFQFLKEALIKQQKPIDGQKVENEWRPLYKFAWTDFHRFLKGWSSGYWGSSFYTKRLIKEVLEQLNGC